MDEIADTNFPTKQKNPNYHEHYIYEFQKQKLKTKNRNVHINLFSSLVELSSGHLVKNGIKLNTPQSERWILFSHH